MRGPENAFVTKLDAAGSALVYSTYLGGNSFDLGHGIAADAAGNAYVTGEAQSTDFPTVNPLQATFGGFLDAFVAKIGPNPPDFSLGAISSLTVPVGGSGSSPVNVNSLFGFNSPVTLSGSSLPAGVSASFNSDPITPPSGGSAASTMTVTLGPSVTPSTFMFTVTGANGSNNHSTQATVTATASASGTTSVIGTLLAAGCIDNAGIANALTSKLAAAQSAISAGNAQTAINILNAFIDQLEAQAGKHIATSCTIGGVTFNPVTVLLSDVQGLIGSLKVSMTADPITGYVVNSSGVGIGGATVSIFSGASTVATATTDITGFYFFPTTGVLTTGANYTVGVSGLPSGFTSSAPASQGFTWLGTAVSLSNFVLN